MSVVLAVVALLLPNEDPALVANARVRVTAPAVADRPLVGRLLAADEASLTLALGRKTVVVPRQALTMLEVSRRPSRKGGAVGIGLVVGGASGAILGYGAVAGGPGVACSLPCDRNYGGKVVAFGALLGGVLGSAIGAAIAPGERWETVGSGRVRVSVAPARRGAGLVLALSF